MEKFFEAIVSNNAEKVKLMLTLGQNPNVKNKQGVPALCFAVRFTEITKLLIDAGADVNAKDDFGRSPLHWADSVEVAELLISAGANVNAKDNPGNSPLHFAIGRNNIALVEFLISAGADVDSKDNWDMTPLYEAVLRGDEEIANMLISAGANANIKSKDGKSLLELMS